MASNQSARCVQHGLVVAHDGLCVLCRRQAAAGAQSPGTGPQAPHVAPIQPDSVAPAGGLGTGVVGVAVLLLMAAAGGAWGWKYVKPLLGMHAQGVASAAAPTAPREPTAQELAAAQSALDQEKARDLEESLKKLERAEAERQVQERAKLENDDARRTSAEAARKKEEAERDAARHKAVAHDLEQLGLEQARRNVQITMYTTEWCGVCKRARKYMQSRSIPFTEHDIEHDAAARDRSHALNPRNSVPVITVDRELLIGFDPESLESSIATAARKRKL